MKRNFYILSALFLTLGVSAQSVTPNDGLRYNEQDLNGTARFNAMGGAFGAVGGDFSAIGINPAGAAIFKYNTANITLKYDNNSNKSTFEGTQDKQKNNSFTLNQGGVVFVFDNPEKKLNKYVLSVNYNTKKNFDNNLYFRTPNGQQSIDSYFLDYANGTNGLGTFPIEGNDAYFEDLNFVDQQAWLGYNSYILDYDQNSNTYFTNVPTTGVLNQSKAVETRGYNSKVEFNFAGSVQDRLFFGVNLNAHFVDFTKTTVIRESNDGMYDEGTTITDIAFNNQQYTFGNGFSLNLGAIYKVNNALRLGLAYESPTWYKLTDQLQQSIYTNRVEAENPNTTLYKSTNPGVVMEFDRYKLRTPANYTASVAGIISNQWLISGDVSVKDYSKTEFTSQGYDNMNNFYTENLKSALDVRVGTEYVIKNVALRAGYRFAESPYKNKDLVLTGDTSSYNAGIGFHFGDSQLDLAYSFTDRNFNEELISNSSYGSKIKNANNAVSLTYTVNF